MVLRSVLTGIVLLCATISSAAIQTPQEFTGRPVGADRVLLDWETILGYLRHLDEESPRLHLETLGESTLGRPFVMAVVADAAGVRDRDAIRTRTRRFLEADRTSAEEAATLASESRATIAFSLGLHSTEVGASQASMEMLHHLVTSEEPWVQEARRRLLILMVPSMNPDGLDIIVDWYNETVGTEAEGSRPPWLYHHYAGHDNNRDGFFNNLDETAMWSKVLYHDWLPQMIVDEHQMGNQGPRLFLPPFDDPISPSVHPLVYAQLAAAGQQTVSDLTAKGWTGIATSTIFSGEWPGSVRSTGFWHNMLGILSEVASARLATPMHFPPGSLRGRGRGLPEYERRANFVEPWPGGWWRLRDIIDLEKDLTWSMLRWASHHSQDLLVNFHRMNLDAIRRGRGEAPYGFVVDVRQHDAGAAPRLAELLRDGGLRVDLLPGPVEVQGRVYPEGVYHIPAAQPFRPFLMEMLDPPPYPMIRQQDGRWIQPYDVTAWRLPDLLQVEVQSLPEPWDPAVDPTQDPPRGRVEGRGPWRLSATDNASYAAVARLLRAEDRVRRRMTTGAGWSAGDFLVEAGDVERLARETGAVFQAAPDPGPDAGWRPQRAPQIGLYAPWGGSMDEGWTRLVLDRAGFTHSRLRHDDLRRNRSGNALRDLDVVVFPSIPRGTLASGVQSEGSPNLHQPFWPDEYRGGLGEDAERLVEFVRAGGTVVAFNHATDWVVAAMQLPVRVDLEDAPREEFFAPGTLLAAEVDPAHPLAWGMPAETAVYFARGRAFSPIPWPRETRVPVRYAGRDVLRAGFLVGAEELEGRPAMLEVPVGRGRVVLFGFSPQRRAQTESTFKLVFNSLLLAGLGDDPRDN